MPLSLDGTGSITGIGTFNFSDEIIHVGDTNTKIRFPANDTISFETAGSERFRIASSGNLEISTTTDTNPRYLKFNSNRSNADDALGGVSAVWNGNSVAAINFKTGADTTNKDDGELQFVTYSGGSPNERVRIDTSGRVLISGQDTFSSTSLTHRLQVKSQNDAHALAIIGRNGDDIGELTFFEADKSTRLGEIQYRQDHVNFRHRVGDIRFASGGATERIRIKSDGKVQIMSGTVIQFTNTNNDIITDTSDGSDNKRITIAAGGTTDSSRGANINLTGNEYSGATGKLEFTAGNSGNSSASIDFYTGGSLRLNVAQNGNLILHSTTGGSVATLKAGGSNTDLRVAAVGTGGFFDVMTNGSDNRMRVDANGHFYTNQQRNRLTAGGPTACSLRWNITSGKNLTQNNSNRDNYGKLNIQAGRANSTTVNDDCTAIRITPAENRSTTVGTKSCGIGFQHLNADTWPEYSGNQVWMGLSLNDTSGQERDRFEIHMNNNVGQGSQPNNLGMRIYPTGVVTKPNQPMCSIVVANTSAGNYMTHNAVLTNNGSHFNTSNNRFVCPVAGFYYASVMVMSNNSNTTMDLELHKNGSNAGNILVPYSAATGGSYNQAVGSCIIECSANDYLQFRLNSGSVYQGRHSNISFCLLA